MVKVMPDPGREEGRNRVSLTNSKLTIVRSSTVIVHIIDDHHLLDPIHRSIVLCYPSFKVGFDLFRTGCFPG